MNKSFVCTALIAVLSQMPNIAFAGVDDGHGMFILLCVETIAIIVSIILAGIITKKNLFGFDSKQSASKLITNIFVFIASFVVIALLLINIFGAIVDIIY